MRPVTAATTFDCTLIDGATAHRAWRVNEYAEAYACLKLGILNIPNFKSGYEIPTRHVFSSVDPQATITATTISMLAPSAFLASASTLSDSFMTYRRYVNNCICLCMCLSIYLISDSPFIRGTSATCKRSIHLSRLDRSDIINASNTKLRGTSYPESL